jgi:xanthine/CO dehydrogenase XdhC/CoxF family maturation factor
MGTVVATFRSPRRGRRGPRCSSDRMTRSWGRCPEGASRVPSTSWPRRSSPREPRSCSAMACPTTTRSVGLTCGGILDVFVETVSIARPFPSSGSRRRRHRRRAAGGGRDRRRAPGSSPGWGAASSCARPRVPRRGGGRGGGEAGLGCRVARHPRPSPGRWAASGPTRPSPTTPGATGSRRGAARRSNTDPTVTPRGGHAGLRRLVRAAAPDARLRRDRLRRGRRPDRGLPRVCRDRLRRAADLRDGTRGSRPPTRWSSTGRTAISPAEVEAGRIDERTVICVLTHDPKFDVPLLEVALAAARRWRMSGPWVRAAPTTTVWPGSARPGSPRRSWRGSPPRSGSIWGAHPPGDGRRSPPRSWRCSGAAAVPALAAMDGPIHHDRRLMTGAVRHPNPP